MILRKPAQLLLSWFLATAMNCAFGADFTWQIPTGFPKPVIPASNPMSDAKIALGRRLFYDKRMSVNGKASCATCHRQDLAFTDGKAHAEGATGQAHPRSAMSLVNAAYAPVLTWANPKLDSLEEQALGPMLGVEPIELGLKGHEEEYLAKLRADPQDRDLFARAFNAEVTLENVTRALAAFERSIVSMRSPYDRYRWGGDMSAISASAKRGEIVFNSSEKGRCFQCHGGWNFSAVRFEGDREGSMGGIFFNTGASEYPAPNRGIFEYTKRAEDVGKFRAPTLRNIAVTAPYMHDGSIATLEAVIDHYAAGGRLPHANKSTIVRPLTLTPGEKLDLIEFLKSLTDTELLSDPRWSDPYF
jgi:cytochrome c peroxidase